MTNYAWPVQSTDGITPAVPARALRQVQSVLLGGASTARPMGGRSGVRQGTPDTTAAISGSTWTCHPHAGVIDGQTDALAGPYGYAIGADVTGTVGAAHATLARTDTLYVLISDPVEDLSGAYVTTVALAPGTPGGSPATPPTGSLPLAWYTRASAAAGGAVTVQWIAPQAAAAGGIIAVRSEAERNLITWGTTLNPALVYRADLGTIEQNVTSSSANWDVVAGGTPATVTNTIPAATVLVGTTTYTIITTSAWTWTPARSGIADVQAIIDVSETAGGYQIAFLRAVRDGTAQEIFVHFEGSGREQMRIPVKPFRVRKGVAVSLILEVALSAGTGNMQINSGAPVSRWQASVS